MKLINLLKARKIINENAHQKVSVAFAYKMMRFLKDTENDKNFYSERFSNIVNTYGQKDDSGNFVIENGNLKLQTQFKNKGVKAVNELDAHEVPVPNIKFTFMELNELKLSATDLFLLEDFIEED